MAKRTRQPRKPKPAVTPEARRRRLRILLAVAALGFLSPFLIYWWVAASTRTHIYTKLAEAPVQHTALLLGTAQRLPGGAPNPFFTHRIEAAALLYQTGKVQRILVSGDQFETYDEPAAMRKALMLAGVPDSIIVLDRQGYRTLDSVVRARDTFGDSTYIIVSQRFHVERALFIARARGIPATGYVAADPGSLGSRVRLTVREMAARLGTVLDIYLLNTQPGPRT